ncbi:phage baseplate protein [Vibrio parahaemolyticus]|uniref:phage baseplate protein n=1 Tax=Vibrio parahaemolyticus TaxID=670 RepID=UPI001121B984|nr:phage baseplate protein [Vibrio parahaemolyticus]TOP74097.1 phage baseplate protein [Vibrio parahaemolyticus]
MIGIDRRTGKMLTGFDQFVSRVTQVMSTRIGAREKRRSFGSRLPELLSRSTSDYLLSLAQTYAMEAFYNPINGISDFVPSRIVATRRGDGLTLRFEGTWSGQWVEPFEINVSELSNVST